MNGNSWEISDITLEDENDDLIDSIVGRACPAARALDNPDLSGSERDILQAVISKWRDVLWLKPIEELRRLAGLSDPDLLGTFLIDEDAFVFNSPFFTTRNREFWAGAANWTADEAAALLLGYDPELVSWNLIKPYADLAATARRFADIRGWILRAKDSGDIPAELRPAQILKWAREHNIAAPPDLERVVGTLKAEGSSNQSENLAALGDSVAPTGSIALERANAGSFQGYLEELLAKLKLAEEELKETKRSLRIEKSSNAKRRGTYCKIIYSLGTAESKFTLDDDLKDRTSGNQIKKIISRAHLVGMTLDDESLKEVWLEAVAYVKKATARTS